MKNPEINNQFLEKYIGLDYTIATNELFEKYGLTSLSVPDSQQAAIEIARDIDIRYSVDSNKITNIWITGEDQPFSKNIPEKMLREVAEKSIFHCIKWFDENPKETICPIELFKREKHDIRKNHIREDVETLVEKFTFKIINK